MLVRGVTFGAVRLRPADCQAGRRLPEELREGFCITRCELTTGPDRLRQLVQPRPGDVGLPSVQSRDCSVDGLEQRGGRGPACYTATRSRFSGILRRAPIAPTFSAIVTGPMFDSRRCSRGCSKRSRDRDGVERLQHRRPGRRRHAGRRGLRDRDPVGHRRFRNPDVERRMTAPGPRKTRRPRAQPTRGRHSFQVVCGSENRHTGLRGEKNAARISATVRGRFRFHGISDKKRPARQ